jgi:hypothetical protein
MFYIAPQAAEFVVHATTSPAGRGEDSNNKNDDGYAGNAGNFHGVSSS